jgi:hypothetical protein
MIEMWKAIGRSLLFLLLALFSPSCHSQVENVPEMRVIIVGFADRWADYGSRGDTPSFRDFLAIRSRRGEAGEFIKLRLLYWPQDKSDPKQLASGPSREMSFAAAREETCDETFASLSRGKQVSYLDPELKPSRFLFLAKAPAERPRPTLMLPCYQVK